MKTRINLYLDELHPQRQWLSLSQLVGAWGGLLLLLLAGGGAIQYLALQSGHQLSGLQQQIRQVDTVTKQLNAQLEARHPDAGLQHELSMRQDEYRSKQQLQQHLSQIGTLQNKGFAAWLYDLAQARSPGIALRAFAIENNQLRLQGEAATNNAVPVWLSHFSVYPTLRERQFSALDVTRQKSGVLQFRLESRDANASAAAGTGK
ncbi:PilN domain-containing protein [Tolumonas lignilytica]|jgi:hypothetical protein|uniref:PilN domain-containing protein n=1 Tax=Tolumonas lignilytica TaxID=1283284 RepID=UPI0004658100|nr:PilN domain-containing protein [Tolumonas lignilytica]